MRPPEPTSSVGAAARRGERYFAHPRRALWIGAALLVLVALTAALVPTGPLALERTWLEAMQDIQTAALENLALVFNWLGRGIGRALSIASIGIVLLVARRWVGLLAFAVTETLTPLCSSLLKAHVDRARPPDGLVHPRPVRRFLPAMPPTPAPRASRSFSSSPPSGHDAVCGGRSRPWVSPAWPGAEPTSRCTG